MYRPHSIKEKGGHLHKPVEQCQLCVDWQLSYLRNLVLILATTHVKYSNFLFECYLVNFHWQVVNGFNILRRGKIVSFRKPIQTSKFSQFIEILRYYNKFQWFIALFGFWIVCYIFLSMNVVFACKLFCDIIHCSLSH